MKPSFEVFATILVGGVLLVTPAAISWHQTRVTADLQASLQGKGEEVLRLEEANRLLLQSLSEHDEVCASEKRAATVPLRYCLVECQCPREVWSVVGQQPPD